MNRLTRFLISSVVLVVLWTAVLGSSLTAAPAATVSSPFRYWFDWTGVLNESGNMWESSSPYWWLSSGGRLHEGNGIGATIQGSLPSKDYWRRYYANTNGVDTDGGYHPQNLFRLVSRSRWKNFRQQVYFRIRRDNLSASPNRNASNGLLLMSRYLDDKNLYYTGIRVDGYAVVKKKIRGTYYTLAYAPFFPGARYDRAANPTLLPKNVWIGVRSDVINNPDGSVRILVYVDAGPGDWSLVFNILDNGVAYGGSALTAAGYAGIRTDFMDVEFENYYAAIIN
jgi:hypothetical protein